MARRPVRQKLSATHSTQSGPVLAEPRLDLCPISDHFRLDTYQGFPHLQLIYSRFSHVCSVTRVYFTHLE